MHVFPFGIFQQASGVVVPAPIFYLRSHDYSDALGWTESLGGIWTYTKTGAGVTKNGNYITLAGGSIATDILLGVNGQYPSFAAGENLTLSAWMKSNSNANRQGILSITNTFNTPGTYYLQGGGLAGANADWVCFGNYYTTSSSWGYRGSNTNPSGAFSGNWRMITTTFDRNAGVYKNFIDGVECALHAELVGNATALTAIASPLRIGTWGDGGSEYLFGGDLGHIRMWNVALSGAEVAQEYSNFVGEFP